jgi:RNA polymerase sigma-70 factor (ECF subfamily)
MGSDDAARFEAHRRRLEAVAYRMLGSLAEADDAVQETWLRFARHDTDGIDNLGGWLTTVVSRICLDMLRARASRREEPWEFHLPDPVVTTAGDDPEERAVVADSVSFALLVVLDVLTPAERLAFVLHDLFGIPFAEIGPMLGRSPAAAKQLASRARHRVRGSAPGADVDTTTDTAADTARRREVADAFLTAARNGDLTRLLAVLDADVVLRADAGDGPLGPSRLVQGASAVARQATQFNALAPYARPIVVNGAPGYLTVAGGRVLTLVTMTVRGDRIVAIDVIADPDRLSRLALPDGV